MDASDFSTEEYECLGAILSDYYSWTGTLSELAKHWLHSDESMFVGDLHSRIKQFMALPLDQVPLYFNETSRAIRVLVRWRLQIAR